MSTAKAKPAYTCPECRIVSPGVHWIDDGIAEHPPRPVPCPARAASELQQAAQELTAEAHEAATRAARQIVTDAARSLGEFSANSIQDELEAAQIPGSVVGPAFTWASKPTKERGPLIEGTGRYVMSINPGTRHKIQVWRSLVSRARRAAS